ncbi:HicB family toxin-antitoxin system [Herbihabitans rhizosphaerae]|uniref:HicB family toxin-antitoxin system n=1 Tax=Herbihabitans rhizosphaerae TaxID=1872711 RepID=UPI00102AD411|nr:HicB family toxin-antitoxin system [Herbihabitans rhizosphaerae]
MKTYHAEVTRDGKFWLIRVREINRSTQALRYKDVEAMASDLVEIMEGLRGDEYNLHLEVQLPSSVTDHQARAEVLREEAQRKQAEAAAESRAAVHELLALGLSQREAGELLGVSFQRVSQLAKSS